MNIAFLNIESEKKSVWDSVKVQNYGVIVLSEILRKDNHTVTIHDSHSAQKNLEKIVVENDLVCFSFYTAGSSPAYRISSKIHALAEKHHKKITRVMGGIHPTSCPEEAIGHSDYVIRGEGEISLPALISELQKVNPELQSVPGLTYKACGEIIHNPDSRFIEDKKLLQVTPARDLDPVIKSWNRTPVLTPARGCPYSCKFCSNKLGRKMRLTDPEWVVTQFEEIIKNKYYNWSKVLFIGSDNFAANKSWAKSVLSIALNRGLAGKINLHIQSRTDIAEDEELLDLMENFVTRDYIGVESFDSEVLKNLNKGISAEKMQEHLSVILKHKIPVHAHLICGTDYDNAEKIKQTVKTAKSLGIYSISLFTLTPFPQTELRKELQEQGRIITSDWDRYNLHHVTVAPLHERPSNIQKAQIQGYRDFYSLSNAAKCAFSRDPIGLIYGLMLWRGFRARDRNMHDYIRFLKKWESDKYDKNNNLKTKSLCH